MDDNQIKALWRFQHIPFILSAIVSLTLLIELYFEVRTSQPDWAKIIGIVGIILIFISLNKSPSFFIKLSLNEASGNIISKSSYAYAILATGMILVSLLMKAV